MKRKLMSSDLQRHWRQSMGMARLVGTRNQEMEQMRPESAAVELLLCEIDGLKGGKVI